MNRSNLASRCKYVVIVGLFRSDLLSRCFRLTGSIGDVMKDVMSLTHRLRDAEDASLAPIASSLSTRQLVRVARRLQKFPEEDAYHVIQKACLARFVEVLPV